MIRVAWGIKGRNTVHHWVFHVFPASCPGPHCYGILATGTKKPGHHKEQEVHFSAGLVFSVLYFFRCRPCVFLLDFHSFPSRSAADSVLYLSASLSLALVHTLHSFSLPRRLSLTLSQPLNLSPALVLALPRLLLTQRTETTGEVFLSRSLSFFFFKKKECLWGEIIWRTAGCRWKSLQQECGTIWLGIRTRGHEARNALLGIKLTL